MRIYKFKDVVDGKFAFIIAKSEREASTTLNLLTSIEYKFIKSIPIDEYSKPIVLLNQILPF